VQGGGPVLGVANAQNPLKIIILGWRLLPEASTSNTAERSLLAELILKYMIYLRGHRVPWAEQLDAGLNPTLTKKDRRHMFSTHYGANSKNSIFPFWRKGPTLH
jgi:hypothetical protein